jgi:16S rRNA (cytidine1402-2'-O)-methyltransferase
MSEDTNEKERGWLLPAAGKKKIAPGLHLVATPIGNLSDITLRALDTLNAADLVVCEDTRVTGKLLSYYGLKKTLLPYNDHNADRQRGTVIEKLSQGKIVALVSDAGMPLISDPGFKLVREVVRNDIFVTGVPGANAVLTALQLSALPSESFCFAGFLPPKETARRKMLTQWKDVPATLIFFETAPRLAKSLTDIAHVLGDRDIAVARELTKMFEEVRRGKASQLLAFYEESAVKGEIVLVVGPPVHEDAAEEDIEATLKKALEDMSTKEAAAFVAERTGRPRKEIYNLALKIEKKV